MQIKYIAVCTLMAAVLSACTGGKTFKPSPSWDIASAEFSAGNALYSAPAVDVSKRKYGNPYTILGKTYTPLQTSEGYRRKGVASWYGKDFHGKKTANGEKYNMYAMTAAHPTLPLPTYVRVTNLENSLSVIVRVNDRGPFLRGRIIDLSYKAAQKLKMADQGTAPVLLEALPTDGSVLNVAKPVREKTQQAVYNRNTVNTDGDALSRPVKSRWTDHYARKNLSEQQAVSNGKNVAGSTVEQEINLQPTEAVKLGAPVDIYIQTGAFSKATSALAERQKLKKVYDHITVQETWAKNRVLHRVRLGPIETIAEADTLLKKVIDAGWSTARITVDN